MRLRMAGDTIGEGHPQAAPFLAVFLPWLDLFGLETRVGVQQRQGKVSPQGLAGEIGDMELVPWAFDAWPSKALSGWLRVSTAVPSKVSRSSVQERIRSADPARYMD